MRRCDSWLIMRWGKKVQHKAQVLVNVYALRVALPKRVPVLQALFNEVRSLLQCRKLVQYFICGAADVAIRRSSAVMKKVPLAPSADFSSALYGYCRCNDNRLGQRRIALAQGWSK